MMLGVPQTYENRKKLREEVADYMCERSQEFWLHPLLVVTQELDPELLQRARQEAHLTSGPILIESPSEHEADTASFGVAAVAAAPLPKKMILTTVLKRCRQWNGPLVARRQVSFEQCVMHCQTGACRSKFVCSEIGKSPQSRSTSLKRRRNSF